MVVARKNQARAGREGRRQHLIAIHVMMERLRDAGQWVWQVRVGQGKREGSTIA